MDFDKDGFITRLKNAQQRSGKLGWEIERACGLHAGCLGEVKKGYISLSAFYLFCYLCPN